MQMYVKLDLSLKRIEAVFPARTASMYVCRGSGCLRRSAACKDRNPNSSTSSSCHLDSWTSVAILANSTSLHIKSAYVVHAM